MYSLLIADSNPAVREALRVVLPAHRVLEACDGEVAVEILTVEDVDLLVLDIELPTTNGWELIQIARDQQNGWPELKIIVLTVMKEPGNIIKAWVHGVSYYITKPFSPVKVGEYIDCALREPVPDPDETILPIVYPVLV